MRASEAALVVVDMQNGYCSPGGSGPANGVTLADLPETIGEIAEARAFARQLGMARVYVVQVFAEGLVDADPRTLARYGRDGARLVRGTWDAAVIDDLAPTPDELVVQKNRFDPFVHSGLERLLRRIGAHHLIVSGAATNACVALTARSAWMRDFSVAVPSDTTTARTRAHKQAALAELSDWLIDTSPWRVAFSRLEASRA